MLPERGMRTEWVWVYQNGVDGETADVWVDAGGPSRAGLGRRSEGVYIGEVDRRMEWILLLD